MACAGCKTGFYDCVIMDDESVLDFLISHRIMKQSTACPSCGSVLNIVRKSLVFRCQSCNKTISARVGTFFERAHMPLHIYLKLITHLLYVAPPRQAFLQSELQIGSRTVVDWYSFCREVFIFDISRSSCKLGGPGKIVEVDEAKFASGRYDMGRLVGGHWLFGGIDRGSKNSFLIPVERRDSITLLEIITTWILPGTTIISDCWKEYGCLQDEGFRHLCVNYSINFVGPETGAHINNIRRTWQEVRATIPRCGRKKVHLAGYLAEYMFKAKYPMKDRIHAFFAAAADMYPPKY